MTIQNKFSVKKAVAMLRELKIRNNFPVELAMAFLVTVVFVLQSAIGSYRESQQEKELAAREEALVLEKEKATAALNKAKDISTASQEIEEEVHKKIEEITSIPSEELIRNRNFFVPVRFSESLKAEEKSVIRNELQKIADLTIDSNKSEDFETLEDSKKNLMERISSFSPKLAEGVSSHQEEGKLPRIALKSDLEQKLLGVEGILGTPMMANLEKFWAELRGYTENDSQIFEPPAFTDVAIAGFRYSYRDEEESILVSRESKNTNPLHNGGIWPAYLKDGPENTEMVDILSKIRGETYPNPDLFDFEKVSVRLSETRKYGRFVSINGINFIYFDKAWRLFFKNHESDNQVTWFSYKKDKFWVLFPRGVDSDINSFLLECLSWEDFKKILNSPKIFKKREFFGVEHFVATSGAEYELSKRGEMWVDATRMTRQLSEKGRKKVIHVKRFGKNEYLNTHGVKDPVYGFPTELFIKLKDEGENFRLEKEFFLREISVGFRQYNKSPSVENSIAKIIWDKKKLVPGKPKIGQCYMMWYEGDWNILLPLNYDFEKEIDE